MRRAWWLLLLLAGCATGPDDPLVRNVVVHFDHLPTDGDILALRAVGGTYRYRIDVARSVVMLAHDSIGPRYRGVPGVDFLTRSCQLEDCTVAVSITLPDSVQAADSTWLAQHGAERVAPIPGGDGRGLGGHMKLSRVQILADYPRFRTVYVYTEGGIYFRVRPVRR